MMESRYWKDELLRAARIIKKMQHVQRWSEKQLCLFEREVMITFFCVRALIERNKLDEGVSAGTIQIKGHPKRKGKLTTLFNRGDIWELFEMKRSEIRSLILLQLCNQIIHSYIIFPVVEAKKFSQIYVCSDFERNRFLYVVPVTTLIDQIVLVGKCYPNRQSWKFDEKAQDYRPSDFGD